MTNTTPVYQCLTAIPRALERVGPEGTSVRNGTSDTGAEQVAMPTLVSVPSTNLP
jgi:hypothetical protein